MPDCPAFIQSGTGMKKPNNARTGPGLDKLTQSGIFLVQYRTKIQDAGMPMPALVSSMLMPSYDEHTRKFTEIPVFSDPGF